ncbi:MCP four helix bundle domain-containing protein, partial [Rhodoferax sp.]|uniref:MCP four helix bundle domain-containing protein n=1 Tax=Rhodoferax sp. TaxID=50421 RepID=UPI00271EB8E3
MNFNNIRLAAKLWLATGLIVLGLCAVIAFAAIRSAGDRTASATVLEGFTNKIKLTNRWAALTETNAARSQAVLLSGDPAVEVGLKAAIAATSAQIGDIQKAIEATELTAADRAQMVTIANNRKAVLASRAAAMKLRADGKPDEMTATINSQYMPAMEAYQKSQRDFVAMQEGAYEASRLFFAQR